MRIDEVVDSEVLRLAAEFKQEALDNIKSLAAFFVTVENMPKLSQEELISTIVPGFNYLKKQTNTSDWDSKVQQAWFLVRSNRDKLLLAKQRK
jgi:hypothetical protein